MLMTTTMETLKLEHLAPYLPYGIYFIHNEEPVPYLLLQLNLFYDQKPMQVEGWNGEYMGTFYLEGVKPILRPMSDIKIEDMKDLYYKVFGRKFIGDNISHRDVGTKEERYVLWSGVERLFFYKDGDVGADVDLHHKRVLPFDIVSFFASKHFDVHGLINKGLAIDINTL